MSLPKYKYLLTYRIAEIIFDLENDFENRFLQGIDNRRTREQRYHAARSGKQNIVEAVGVSDTSKKGELKLLGISKGSYEELIGDNEDYLRQHNLEIYTKTHPKVTKFRQTAYRLSHLSNLSHLGHLKEKPVLPDDPQDAANFLLTLCHMETFLLDRQIKSLENRFVEVGGYTENLFKKRLRVKIDKSPK